MLQLKKKFDKNIDTSFVFATYKTPISTKIENKFIAKAKNFESLIPDSLKLKVYQNSVISNNVAIENMNMISNDYKSKKDSLRIHEIEWHKRFTYSISCLVLFLIGAPLGSIIRKGGLGAPLVFAIVFFAVFYLLNTFGEKLSKENVMSAFTGIWFSIYVLVPVAFFLIFKAMRDSQLFNNEFYYRLFRHVKTFISNFKTTS